MSFDDPRAAFAQLVSERGESLAALSRLLGRNAAYLQQYVTRGSPKRLDERDRRLLARYFGVSEQLFGGPEEPDLVTVPRIDVRASAGHGTIAGAEHQLRPIRFDRAMLRALKVRAEAASMIGVVGDSMLPTLAPGDEILVDRDDRTVTPSPDLFVIREAEALLVKRVSFNGGAVIIASDNPAYPAVSRPHAAVEIIGRVVWLGRSLRRSQP